MGGSGKTRSGSAVGRKRKLDTWGILGIVMGVVAFFYLLWRWFKRGQQRALAGIDARKPRHLVYKQKAKAKEAGKQLDEKTKRDKKDVTSEGFYPFGEGTVRFEA